MSEKALFNQVKNTTKYVFHYLMFVSNFIKTIP